MSKRANGEGNIRKRPDGKWEGRYMFDGKRHSVYGKTQAEVRKKLTEAQAQIDGGAFVAPSKITVAEWGRTWLSDCLHGKNQETVSSYESKLRLHIIPAIGQRRLTELRPLTITNFYNQLQDKGLSDKTISCIHGALHKMLQDAMTNELVKENVCDKVHPPKTNTVKQEMHPLKDQQVSAFLLAIKGTPFEPLFYTALFTGARESELIGLTWNCIDFERGTIHLYRQLKRDRAKKEYVFTTLKNRESRTFAPPANVLTMLKAVRKNQAEWQLKAGECWNNTDNLVFTNEIGGHLCTFTVYNHFKRVMDGMGLHEVRLHDLRHTYSVLALQNGMDYKTLSHNLGHATVAFTMDVYGHVSETMMQNSAEIMQRYIESL